VAATGFICTVLPYGGCGSCWPVDEVVATRTDMVSRRWLVASGAGLRPLLTWQAIQADWLKRCPCKPTAPS
jgi:hypothetical protein